MPDRKTTTIRKMIKSVPTTIATIYVDVLAVDSNPMALLGVETLVRSFGLSLEACPSPEAALSAVIDRGVRPCIIISANELHDLRPAGAPGDIADDDADGVTPHRINSSGIDLIMAVRFFLSHYTPAVLLTGDVSREAACLAAINDIVFLPKCTNAVHYRPILKRMLALNPSARPAVRDVTLEVRQTAGSV